MRKIILIFIMLCAILFIPACSRNFEKEQLVYGNSEELFVYLENQDLETAVNPIILEQWKVKINTNLLTDPNVEKIRFNLPEGVNFDVMREKIVKCEENPNIASHLCSNNQYTWYGIIPKEDFPEESPNTIILVVSDNGVTGSIPANIGIGLDITEHEYGIVGPVKGEEYYILSEIDSSKYPLD